MHILASSFQFSSIQDILPNSIYCSLFLLFKIFTVWLHVFSNLIRLKAMGYMASEENSKLVVE